VREKNRCDDISILVVEDEHLIRQTMVRMLQREATKQTFEAADGLEGFEQYQTHSPDIILTDIRMPRMDGLKMIHRIRESDPKVKIIVLTAYSDRIAEIESAGVNAHFAKPFDWEKFAEILTGFVADIRASRDASTL